MIGIALPRHSLSRELVYVHTPHARRRRALHYIRLLPIPRLMIRRGIGVHDSLGFVSERQLLTCRDSTRRSGEVFEPEMDGWSWRIPS